MSTAEQLKVAYDGIEITYDESSDSWKFELRGRARSAESLAKAKEYIDKPIPADKKAFARIPAVYMRYYDATPDTGEITSIAETPRYSSLSEVWFVGSDKARKKLNARDMYNTHDENKRKMAQIVSNQAEVKRLNEASRELYNALEKIDLSGCE